MVPVRDCEVVEASHEPQKVAQASCLFGADRLEACPTLQPAARFMAPTHVQFLEVFPSHEPYRSSSSSFSSSSSTGRLGFEDEDENENEEELVHGANARWQPWRLSMNLKESCLFGADRLEACPSLQPTARFMASTHVLFWEVFALHELCPLTPPSPPPRGRGCPKGG